MTATLTPSSVLGDSILGSWILGAGGGITPAAGAVPTVYSTIQSQTPLPTPHNKQLRVVRSASYAAEITLWQNEALTEPWEPEGWLFWLELESYSAWTVGNQLAVQGNTVSVLLTPQETILYPAGKLDYVLWAEQPTEDIRLPVLTGVLAASNPVGGIN